MNVFWPEGLQKLADSGEITFKDGERLNLNILRRMENGLYLISLKGKSFTAKLDIDPDTQTRSSQPQTKQGNTSQQAQQTPARTIRVEVVKTKGGSMQLRFIPKAENSSNPMEAATETASDGKQKLVLRLPAGTIDVQPGEKVPVQILKTLENGNTLVAVKNNLFEVKLDKQLLKTITAEVFIRDNGAIELIAEKLPVENLNPNYVKQEVGGFDIEKVMKAFGKFQPLNLESVTPDSLKQAVKNSGLFMESRLLKGENVSGDEKLNAIIRADAPATDGITKMQLTNLMLAGGMLAFLKTADKEVEDTVLRYKRGRKGQSMLYVNTKFSVLGETLIIIRSLNTNHDVMIKTETDISELLKEVDIPRVRLHWFKFSKKDLEPMNVKDDIVFNMGNFEVII